MNARSTAPAPRVDSHQHFWRVSRGDYGWLAPSLGVLYRDYEPEHLQPILDGRGIESTILVQAAPTVAETRFLLQLAERHSFIAGVVGWVDLEHADAAEILDFFSASPKFVGIRPMVQDIPDPNWMLKPSLAPGLHALAERGLAFDALVRPRHMQTLLQFCARYPDLTIVLDHAAKPDIRAGIFEPWATHLRELAKCRRVRCKLSGLATQAGSPAYEAIAPYVDHVIDCFGAERALWGSDWPVCQAVCSYSEWLALSERLLARLTPAERSSVFGTAARNTYRLSSNAGQGSNAHA